jgi:hypothetical protein
MKTIYYVIQKNINQFDEATGTKEVRAYEIKNGKLASITEIEIDNTENSESSLLSELEAKNLIQSKPNLIEL